ncbi:MAG: hypothetical protein KC731_18295 [Myxococcales bacterium]|nr:hypothetical protein [Myxococcales bacterium]
MMLLTVLRDPDRAVAVSRDPARQGAFARSCLIAIVVGGALFGAAVGSFRGGAQIAVAAAKIPVVTLLTMAVAGPALLAIAAAFGRLWTLPQAIALMLAAGARSSLVLGALSPVLWLAVDLGAGHQAAKLAATLAYAAAGLSGASLLLRGLGREAGQLGAAGCFAAVFLVAGAQTAWVLRPYLGDPRDEVVPVLVSDRVEGGVLGSLRGSPWSR